MRRNSSARAGRRLGVALGCALLAVAAAKTGAVAGDDAGEPATRTPIKRLVIIIGENRSFDHVFGTYRPKPGQTIDNLLSKGVVNADGTPGPDFAKAAQFQAMAQPRYYIGAAGGKTPYVQLPPPALGGAPPAQSDTAPPFRSLTMASAVAPALADDALLLTTGASGAAGAWGIDRRIAQAGDLPNGPFQITGPHLSYDSYTGDTVHRFYQGWQQSDCSPAQATRANPSGCLSDLYPFVATSFSAWRDGGGNAMAFYNIDRGDAPFLKRLADEFTLSDNFHQSVQGGTGANHIMLAAGDAMFWSDGHGRPAPPPARFVADPDPLPGTNNRYTRDANWSNCADAAQPGVGPIRDYLQALGLSPRCAAGHFYMLNNTVPAFRPNGTLRTSGAFVPPSDLRTIGDALAERHIAFAYYGGAYRAAVNLANGSTDPKDAVGAVYCEICNFLQYETAIMRDPARRAAHLRDILDLFAEIDQGTLPAVAFVKPDGLLDGHPASSKLGLFEAVAKHLLDRLQAKPSLAAETAVFILFDEGGGYYDSGYIQPLDFFGDGVRVPLIAVSPFSRGGRVVHTYYDHVSILKFIEWNWRLPPLTRRSRDNLPNPIVTEDNPYVPRNRPAIGDLREMFDFGPGGER
jgi:phospholipase C